MNFSKHPPLGLTFDKLHIWSNLKLHGSWVLIQSAIAIISKIAIESNLIILVGSTMQKAFMIIQRKFNSKQPIQEGLHLSQSDSPIKWSMKNRHFENQIKLFKNFISCVVNMWNFSSVIMEIKRRVFIGLLSWTNQRGRCHKTHQSLLKWLARDFPWLGF